MTMCFLLPDITILAGFTKKEDGGVFPAGMRRGAGDQQLSPPCPAPFSKKGCFKVIWPGCRTPRSFKPPFLQCARALVAGRAGFDKSPQFFTLSVSAALKIKNGTR